MSRGFFAMDPAWWPLLLEQLRGAGPLTDEAVRADLRYLQDQALAPRGTWPSLHELADRWGWTSRTGRPAIKRVRLVLRDEQAWADPHKAEAWAAFRGAAVEEGHDEGTTRARRWHGEGTARARRGHAADRSNLENEPAEGTARAREGHDEGTDGARRGHEKGHTRAVSTCTSTPTVTCTEGEARDARPPPPLDDHVREAWALVRGVWAHHGLVPLDDRPPRLWRFRESVERFGVEVVVLAMWWFLTDPDANWQRGRGGEERLFHPDRLEAKVPRMRDWCRRSGLDLAAARRLIAKPHLPWEHPPAKDVLEAADRGQVPFPATWSNGEAGDDGSRWEAALRLVGGWEAWCDASAAGVQQVAAFQAAWLAARDALPSKPYPWLGLHEGNEDAWMRCMVEDPEGRPLGRRAYRQWAGKETAWQDAGGDAVFEELAVTPPGLTAFAYLWAHHVQQGGEARIVRLRDGEDGPW